MSSARMQIPKGEDKWTCKYCSMQNDKYIELCKRCGRGVAPELFLPPRHNVNLFILIVFFFILVMIILFSRLPQKNVKHFIKHYSKNVTSREVKNKN